MTMERDSLVARLGKLHEYDLVLDTNAYPKGPMAEGRDVYRVIGWEGADRGGLLLSEVEAREVRAAFRESSAAAALSRPEQVVIPTSERPTSDATSRQQIVELLKEYATILDRFARSGAVKCWPGDNNFEDAAVYMREAAAMLASAPASPAIGIQAVKALADRVRALLLVDQPASWEERRKIADELESLSALHPAPEAASAAAECCSAISPCSWQRHNGMDDVCPPCIAATGSPVSPPPSDTAPSPKGVSDGVREAFENVDDEDWRRLFLMLPDSGYGSFWKQVLSEIRAALSQEPAPATAEERAASKEGGVLKPGFNDRIIEEGFPDGWFIQDRLDSNEALLCRRTGFAFPASVCVCLRPRATTTDDWLPIAQTIARSFDAENSGRRAASKEGA